MVIPHTARDIGSRVFDRTEYYKHALLQHERCPPSAVLEHVLHDSTVLREVFCHELWINDLKTQPTTT